ncbi:30S ribosomal protein S4e [Methanobrevibacter filiformis]|uniref:Small ribosomal subunit protein eS4 n=1 Tax=Methanobrevibacter filiformis TaxID=55758 RepID=A0A165ZHI7_9EURY|nr:30S ribosomal protein S4e [Methanobrevibacter filiformis]KZX10734.1 30S ribosomal protein S4e [Methanobrevibacter filiformis]
MANMGSRKHLKRFKAPRTWPIHPKVDKWTVKPAAGSHAIEYSLPLLVVIRDILKLSDNSREAKRIINTGNVLVDGRARKDYKFPVGFMDVIQIPKTEGTYRVLPDAKGRLTLHNIPDENANFKLCKVINKTTIKEGKNQLNLHDGRNVTTEEDISAGDVISLKVPDQEIAEVYEFSKGSLVLVTGGKHTGEIGKINDIVINDSSKPNTVVIENDKKDTFITLKDYAFVIGSDEPVISLPGGK